MTPKAIFFDVDGTLLDFAAYSRHFLERACTRRGLPFSDELVRNFTEINDRLWKDIEKGALTRDELHRIRFKLVFEAAGIKCDRPDLVEAEFRKEIFDSAETFDGAREALDYLSKRYPLYVASNAQPEQQTARLEKAGLLGYFDGIFASGEIGADKPSREFWDKVFSRLGGVKPCETVLVGDSITADIAGGNDYGIKTCWFNNGGQCKEEYPCDYEIRDLREITKLF